MCFLLVGVSVQLLGNERELQRKEAGELVKIWLTSQRFDTGSPRFALEPDPDHPTFPDFYFFSPVYEQSESAPTLGHFAVNRKTGDVWDWELCQRLQSGALRAAQKSLRKKLGLSEQKYNKFSKLAPCSGPT